MPDRDRAAERAGIEREIDALYQRPPGEFTAARNELAKGLTKAGHRDEAARIKALGKPTTTPWAVNQVYWQARSIWDRLLAAGAALRTAQIAALERPGTSDAEVQRQRDRLREAGDTHRKAIADAVHQATRAAAQAGLSAAAEPVTRMLESLSLAPQPPAQPGRFTEVMAPAGFEALAGVVPANALFSALAQSAGTSATTSATAVGSHAPGSADITPAASRGPSPARPAVAARAAAKAEAQAAAREHARRVQAAVDAVAHAKVAERAAAATAASARATVDDVELRLTQARRALAEAERAASTATADRHAAEEALAALRRAR